MSGIEDTEAAGGAVAGGGGGSGSDNGPPVRVVRYGAMGWVGEFMHKAGAVFGCGSKVVVQTERGIELGQPVGVPCRGCGSDLLVPRGQLQTYVKNSGPDFCRPRAGRILRAANEQDLNEHYHLNANVREDIDHCAALAARLGLDMKIVTAEHLLGGERIVFYFGSPGRIDFRQLVNELAQRYRTRIEMRQVGARDEARLVADYEVCGRECCCKNFLKKLRPVNMKMAKLQKSTLDPSKVSGRCGRLRCCLRYEHYGYEELADRLPRIGSRVDTEFGPATVADRQILTQLVSVRSDDGRVFTIPLEEIRAFNLPPLPATPKPVPAPPPTEAEAEKTEDEERSRRSRRRGRARRGFEPERPGPSAAEAPPAADEGPRDAIESAFEAAPPPAPVAADSGLPSAEPAAGTEGGVPPGSGAEPRADVPTARPEGARRRRRRGRRRRGGSGGPPPPKAGPGG